MMKKFWVASLIVLVIAGGIYFAISKKKNSNSNTPVYKEAKVTRGDLTKSVAASGKVISNLDVEIKCKASGEIIELPYDIGDTVTKGQLIVRLDPSDEERNVELSNISLGETEARRDRVRANLESSIRNLATARERANADLSSAQAQADQAKSKADRTQGLFDQGFASKDELEQAQTSLETANANLENVKVKFKELDSQEADLELIRKDVSVAESEVHAAEINVETANQRLEDTKVYAPMDGIVTARLVQTGQIISSGISATTGGTSVMKLSDLSRIFVTANVDESDIGDVRNEHKVSVSVDAFPNEKFEGVVVRMAKAGENVSNVVTFEVRIEIVSENKSLLMPEMTADNKIYIAKKQNVLMIPSTAVSLGRGKSTVQVPGANGEPETREIVTGIDDGINIEVVSGLSENDVVLVKDTSQASEWRRNGNQSGPPAAMRMMGPPR
jgi:HlyD family secretion protein